MHLQHLVHPAPGQAVGPGQPAQVGAGAAVRVHPSGVQQRAHSAQRRLQLPVPAAVDEHPTGVRVVQPERHAHGGGLAGTVRAEEPGDPAGFDGERQIVDRDRAPVALGQADRLNHGDSSSLAPFDARRLPEPPGWAHRPLVDGQLRLQSYRAARAGPSTSGTSPIPSGELMRVVPEQCLSSGGDPDGEGRVRVAGGDTAAGGDGSCHRPRIGRPCAAGGSAPGRPVSGPPYRCGRRESSVGGAGGRPIAVRPGRSVRVSGHRVRAHGDCSTRITPDPPRDKWTIGARPRLA